MGFKINKNIPIPDKQKKPGSGRTRKYPFDKMDIGDSFFIEGYNRGKFSSIMGSAISFVKRHNPDWLFTSRKENDGIRIWRIK